MRKSAFTLIEVTAALAIFITVLLVGGWLLPQAVQARREQAFFTEFEQTWRTSMRDARRRRQDISVKIGPDVVTFTVGGQTTIAIPKGLRVVDGLGNASVLSVVNRFKSTTSYGFYTTPATVRFLRANGRTQTYTIQLGWGVLFSKSS